MLGLVERLRTLRQHGLPVRAFGISDTAFTNSPGDMAMARGVWSRRQESPDELIVVLVGANHARQDADLSLGGLLRDWGTSPISLALSHSGGSLWGCVNGRCAQTQVEATSPDAGQKESRTLEMEDVHLEDDGLWRRSERDRSAFQGRFWVGPITASPPAGTP